MSQRRFVGAAWDRLHLFHSSTIVFFAQAIVWLTPTKKDDIFLAKIKSYPMIAKFLKVLEKFAPFKKKESKPKEKFGAKAK